MRRPEFDGIESAPRWILMLAGAYLIASAFALYLWNLAGQIFTMQGTSGGTSSLAVTGMAAFDLGLCLVVLRSFPAGAPLRRAWFLIALASALRTASGLMGGVPGTSGQRAAWIAGGPVQMALLAAAIFDLLRVLRRFGFWRRPGAADWAVCGLGVLFTLCRAVEAAGRPIGMVNWISLAGLPILCVLFLEAMLLRHAVVRMGNGLIAKCWAALAAAILLSGAGEVALWAIPHYSQTLPLSVCEALIRLPIAAAFALVPAYQVAAQRRALKPLAAQDSSQSSVISHCATAS